jgi:hypothetical protein
MAGPTLVVRFLGDLKGLGSALGDVEKKAGSTAASAHRSFSTFLGSVNRTGVLGPLGDSIADVDQSVQSLGEHGTSTGVKIGAIGAGVATAGAVLSTFASKEQASHQQLQAAIGATGKSYDQYADRIDGAIKKQERYGHTASETDDALRALTQATHDPAKALDLLGEASDVAAAKHEGLSSAATQMGKVYNGNTRLLKEFGITAGETATKANKALETATKEVTRTDEAAAKAKEHLSDVQERLSGKSRLTISEQQSLRHAQEDVTSAEQNSLGAHRALADAQDRVKKAAGEQHDTMRKLAEVTRGQASAAADTFRGKLDEMKAKLEDSVSTLGQKYGPAIQILGVSLTGLATIYEIVAAAEWSSVWPVLAIIGAIALLAAAAFVIYKNWGTIWAGMKDAVQFVWNIVQDVWHWIAANWPLLLAILLGPIAIAVALIVTHFGTVKAVVKDAVDFIIAIWNGLVSFFGGVVARIGAILGGIWGDVAGASARVIDAIRQGWDGLVAFVDGLPGRIASGAVGMFDGILRAFESVINGIARAWNSTVGALHVDIPSWVPGIGGHGFDAPRIPSLQAGGIVTRTGLILAHAGEAVSPIPPGGLGGPAVVIENATFAETLDVDAFMRRVAFVAQRAGV